MIMDDWARGLLPFTFIITVLASLIKKKNYSFVLVTCVLIFIFGSILNPIGKADYQKRTQMHEMEKIAAYNKVIDEIETYKTKNHKYPADIKNIKLPQNDLKFVRYETKENSREFVFSISTYEGFIEYYSYCSTPKYEQCHPHIKYPWEYVQRGKWIKATDHDSVFF